MVYDAFVSYSRQDEAWAVRLCDDLAARGFNVFFDRTRLNLGEKWDEQLRDALIDSRHLLLLWSDTHAAGSEWVREEAAGFRLLIHQDFREGRAEGRQFIQVCLEGRGERYKEYQSIALGIGSAPYLAGIAALDPNVWSKLVEQIAAGIDRGDALPEVHQVVLASTRDRMSNVPGDHSPTTRAETFDQLIARIGFTGRGRLLDRYDDERCNWRPFGSDKNILTILNSLRVEAMERGAPPFRWKPVGAEFWAGSKRQVDAIVDGLCTEPAVIVLDALSLYDKEVFEQYDRLLECLANESAAMMVLPPYFNNPRCTLRNFLELAAEKLFDQYYRPKLALGRRVLAQCNVITDDEIEMSRLVQYVVTPRPKQRHQAVRVR